MENKKITISLVASFLFATNIYATELSSITVTSPLVQTNEKDASFLTEIYTNEDIRNSKSKDIYDFLSSETSIVIAPNSGNKFAPKVDMRGYGLTDGYQNLVISVNGRRLNNIDGVPQLLSSIPLETVKKIEVIKGSGSVQYGDGANAGVINIITTGTNSNYIKTSYGSNHTKNAALSLGYSNDNFIINGYLDYTSTNGTRALKNDEKDDNYNRNKEVNIIYFPTENLELRLGRLYSNMNIKYAGALTLDEYKENPNQATIVGWDTEQYFASYVTNAGLTYDINRHYSLDINFSDENKQSFYSSGWGSTYEYKSFNSKLNIDKNIYKIVLGIDSFNADRLSPSNTTSKDNKAIFLSSEYNLNNDLKFSLGARKEKVSYDLTDAGGKDRDIKLNAFDLGFNYSINDNSSIFANFNKSYQAPDLDRLFWYGSFVGYLEPAKVNTFNVGYTNITSSNKLKVSLFRSDLKNEIYFYKVGATQKNTNIDKSHKYGLEIFDKYKFNKDLYASINYSYIIAKIDEEEEGTSSFDGSYLPGVSKHNVTVNLAYEYKKFKTILSHTYRSEAYAAEDFSNDNKQKQEEYNSTNVTFSYDYKNFEIFGKIQNIFDEDNGIWISDNEIYPHNFERTYYAGIKYKF